MRKIQYIGFVGLLLMGMGTQMQAQQYKKGWQVGAALPIALDGLKDWTNEPIMGLCIDGAYVMPMPGNRAYFRAGLGLNYLPGKAQKIKIFQIDPYLEEWKNDTRTISLTGIQIIGDVVVPLGSTNFSLVTGFSLNTWHKKVSGVFPYDWREISGEGQWVWRNGIGGDGYHPLRVGEAWHWDTVRPYYPIDRLGRDNEFSGTVSNVFGRLGLRLGAEYAVNDKFTIAAMFQLTELGTDAEFLHKKFRVDYDVNGNEEPDSENKEYGAHRVNPSWIQIGVRYRF